MSLPLFSKQYIYLSQLRFLLTALLVAGMDTNREFLLVTRLKRAADRCSSSGSSYKAHIFRSMLLMLFNSGPADVNIGAKSSQMPLRDSQ